MICACQMMGQHKIGVRAGLNRAIIQADNLESGENFKFRGGFHFGVNYTYKFSPVFGLRGELLFTQRGSSFTYNDSDSYRVIRRLSFGEGESPFLLDRGETDIELELSNGYLSIPITAQFDVSDKWELFAGASIDILLNPTGRGTLDYTSNITPDDIFFLKSLDHSYRTDSLGQINDLLFAPPETTAIIVNGQRSDIVRVETAYYNLQPGDKDGTKFNLFDAHVILGANYFINNGFYVGIRGELGLFDLTNDGADFTLKDLDENDRYILRDDRDLSRNISVSIGFRF